jgi:phosphoribosylformylglycinamidine cyclo-ligase
MSRPDEKAYEEVIEGIVDAALTNKLALLGGETAILPDLMYGLDVVCTVLAVKEFDVVNKAREGDVVLGLLSNGIHANGYSLVRKVLEGSVGYDVVVDGVRISDEVLKPVRNYGPLIIDAFSSKLINSAAHITGGSFKKVRRVLSNDLNIFINAPKPPKIFEIIMSLGRVSVEEMYRVFNMGVGMVVTLPEENLQDFKYLAVKHNVDFVEVGYVMKGSGKVIVKTYYGDVVEF